MSATDVQVGVASTFVCEPIGRWLGVWLDALGGTTVRPRLRFAGYQQLHQELHLELQVLGTMQHKHIVTLLGWCPEENCLVTELAEKGNLKE